MTVKGMGPSPEMIENFDRCAPEVAAYMEDLMNQCGGLIGDRLILLEMVTAYLFWHWQIAEEAEFRTLRTMAVNVRKRLAAKRQAGARTPKDGIGIPEGNA